MRPLARLEGLLEWFPRHAPWVLAAVLLVTAVAAGIVFDVGRGRLRLEVDASSDRLLPEGDASRRFFDRVRTVFGSDETVLVAFEVDDVFTTEHLERIARMTRRIAALEGVDRVLSISNALIVRAVAGDVTIAPFLSAVPTEPQALEALRSEALGDPIYGGSLVSRDGRVACLLVYFAKMSNREFLDRGLDEAIAWIADEEKGPGRVWLTGGPHVRAETARILLGETFSLSAGILAVLGVVLLISFRSPRGVVLPLLTIVVAVLWTLALATLWGEPLNAVTSLVPPILTALGLSYSVHVVSEDDEMGRRGASDDPRSRVSRATRSVALPVGLTGLTTAAGFASLALSPAAAVRQFGLLSVVGVLCTMVASLTFTPAILALLPASHREPALGSGRRRPSFERLAERVARFDIRHRRPILVGAALVFAAATIGASQLRIGTQQIRKFPPDAPVRLAFEAVNAHLEGANPFYVIVESDAPDAFKEPTSLRALEELQAWLERQPEIGDTTSVVDYVKVLHRGFRDGEAEALAVPDSRRLVSQLLLFGSGEQLDRFVDSRFQTASIHVRARVIDSDEVGTLVDRVEEHLAGLPGHLNGTVTGTAVVLTRALDDVMRGQAWSVVAALGIIYVILAALFVSPRIGFLALLPNVLPVVVYFGALGFLGVRLDPGTSLVAPMVLGIAVDDTIHYFTRFVREVRRTADEERATVAALKAVGRPVTYTTLALCAGFLVLTTSQLRSQVELGAMAAFALAFAWLCDFLLTPALCARLRVATLWDMLTVDLGRDAQRSISLMRGLRASQARLVALLGSVVEVAAGERLFARGEPGGAVYAVLDGRLRASLEQEGRRIDFGEARRGDTLGEAGFLPTPRALDVDALTDARLLRLTQSSIDQLSRRYPRIATVVYRNLTGLAAEQLERANRGWNRGGAWGIEDGTGGRASSAEDGTHAAAAAGSGGAGEQRAAARPSSRGAGRPDLVRRIDALAEAFFGEGGEEDRLELRRLERAGVAAAGEADPVVAAILRPLGVPLDGRTAVLLVPLAEVAWADGRLERSERQAVLRAASGIGLPGEGPALRRLAGWLDRCPSEDLLERWRQALEAICAGLSVESRLRLRDALLGDARAVAQAAGGWLGVGAVSQREEGVLAELEDAFSRVERRLSREAGA